MKLRLGILLLTFAFCVTGCWQLKNDGQPNMDDLRLIIADPEIDRKTLIQAIRKLGPVTESAQFWVDMANSEQYGQDHRRQTVFQLFKRHVSPGLTLAELAQILDNPGWLANEDIAVVTALTGEIPVKWTLEDTVFVLSVFPALADGRYDHWAIYLRVSGQVDRESFISLLRGGPASEEVKQARVLEIALSPDDPTRVDG